MNKLWLVMLSLPFTGFAQNNEDFESQEELFVFEDEQVAEEVACGEESYSIPLAGQRKPAYCAYCGAALVAQEKTNEQVASTEPAQSQEKRLVSKRRGNPTAGSKTSGHAPRRLDNLDRPRVTQRTEAPAAQDAGEKSSGLRNVQQNMQRAQVTQQKQESSAIESPEFNPQSSSQVEEKHISSSQPAQEVTVEKPEEQSQPSVRTEKQRKHLAQLPQRSAPPLRQEVVLEKPLIQKTYPLERSKEESNAVQESAKIEQQSPALQPQQKSASSQMEQKRAFRGTKKADVTAQGQIAKKASEKEQKRRPCACDKKKNECPCNKKDCKKGSSEKKSEPKKSERRSKGKIKESMSYRSK